MSENKLKALPQISRKARVGQVTGPIEVLSHLDILVSVCRRMTILAKYADIRRKRYRLVSYKLRARCNTLINVVEKGLATSLRLSKRMPTYDNFGKHAGVRRISYG